MDVSLGPSFWAALPQHLPCLQRLDLGEWDHHGQDPGTLAAMAQFVTSYTGQPLQLCVGDLQGLRPALGLPPAEDHTLQLPLA